MIRNDLIEMIALAERLQAAGEPGVLATLFAANGSTYRPLGSMMLSGPSPAFMAGGVSGGCLEEYIVRRGRELTDQRSAVMLSFDADPDLNPAGAPSLGCGGSIEVLVERFTPAHFDFLRRHAAAHDADVPSTAACVVDTSSSAAISVRRIVWDCGEEFPPCDSPLMLLRERALFNQQSIQDPIAADVHGLVHYVRPLVRLVILGAGNDAQPLCSLGCSLGWHVSVADRRARLATRSRFPQADQIVTGDWWNALRSITFTPQTAVAIMTHSLEDDTEILSCLFERPMAYIGVLGPRHRRRWLLESVEQATVLPETFTSKLRGPIGLDLGDRSPGGIAVAIVAEILAELNAREPAPLYQATGDVSSISSRVAVANGY